MSTQGIALWAKQKLEKPEEWVILDTETTEMYGEIIDLAIVRGDGQVLFNQLIKPLGEITQEVQEIHQITDADVQDQPTWLMVWPRICEILSQTTCIISYNANYDADRIVHTNDLNGVKAYLRYERGGIHSPKYYSYMIETPWKCLMRKYAEFYGERTRYNDFKWQKLDMACSQMGIEHAAWHRALGDCTASLLLMRAMAASYVDKGPIESEGS